MFLLLLLLLLQEHTNPNVDLPAESTSGSSSINLAGGFGTFDDEDDDMLFGAPNVKRWATLAVYQRVDGGNDDDDDVDDGDDELIRSHHTMMHSNVPQSFTSFGGGSGFGQDMSGFGSDDEVEIGRAHPEGARQSLGLDTSPVAMDRTPSNRTFQADAIAPVDDSFSFGGDGFGDDMFGPAGDDDAVAEGDCAVDAPLEQATEPDQQPSAPPTRTKRRLRVKFDEATTLPRKSLKMKASTVPVASRVQDRDLQIWNNVHPALHPAPLTGIRLDAVFATPASMMRAPAVLKLFASSLAGTLRIGAPTPSKRDRSSISGGDDEAIEVARRRSEASMDGASAFEDDWGANDYDNNMSDYQAPLDGDLSIGEQAAHSDRPHNAALEDALRRHQAAALETEHEEEDPDSVAQSSQDSARDDKLHPRTLVVMREINRQIGDSSEKSGATDSPAKPTKSLRFADMVSGFGKAPAAAAFFEILALKTRGYIDVEQNISFSDIAIETTGSFVDPAA